MTQILFVEDDEMIGTGLAQILGLHGYQVRLVSNCREALAVFHAGQYKLCILDIRLPDGSGLELCRRLRRYTDIPILFLSGYEDESCIVEALRSGGDDYMIKPFRTMELLARIEVLLRRRGTARRRIGYESSGVRFLFGSARGESDTGTVDFTGLEWLVLQALLEARGTILTPEILISKVTNDLYTDTREVRVWISRLRGKIAMLTSADCIETCRGLGYRWALKTEDLYE